jgi:uncharacterized protein (DUF2249 family)
MMSEAPVSPGSARPHRISTMNAAFTPVQSEAPIVFRFDARGIAKRFRQVAIFASLETLRRGETMRLVAEPDPLPLLDQVVHRYGNAIEIRYVERGAERVVIDFERG